MDGGAGGLTVVDVVVVGAGPAGTATAITCGAGGARVLLLAGSRRDRPGETLHPGVEPLFDRLGVTGRVAAAGFLRHPGVRVAWDGPERLVPYGADAAGPWRGFQAPGAELDALLRARAAELGVEVRDAAAVRPLVSDGRVTGVGTARGLVSAPFIVDAAGGHGWLARHLQLPRVRHSPVLLARFGYRAGGCPEHDAAPLIRADGEGWTWIARVAAARYAWLRVPLRGGPVPRDWVPPDLRGLAPHGPTRTADVSWRALRHAAGPGWLAVGDAAAVLDPASSHGVLRALLSGMAAGHAIVGGAPPDGYAAWLRDWFEHDAAALRDLYGRHPCPPPWVRDW